MKMRNLIWLVSLAILGSVLSLVRSNHPAASANPILTSDGGAPVPPPIPIPWVPTHS